MADWLDNIGSKSQMTTGEEKLLMRELGLNEKPSKIRDFNEMFGVGHYGLSFSDILEGKVDLSTHPYGDNAKAALSSILSAHEGRYQNFIEQAEANFQARQNRTVYSSSGKEAFHEISQNNQQKMNITRNVQIIENFMATVQTPKLYQQIDLNQANLFTPYTVSSKGVPLYSTVAQTERLAGIYGVSRKREHVKKAENLQILDDIANSRKLPFKNGSFKGMGEIWASISSPFGGSAYNKSFSPSVQQYIEDFELFYQNTTNPNKAPHNGFITMDIETFGNKETGELFHVNEIAAQKFRYDKKLGQHVEGEVFSWLVKPTNAIESNMRKIVSGLEQNPHSFMLLTSDAQRSVIDLMRYSTSNTVIDSNKGFDPATFTKGIDGQVNVVQSNATDLNNLYHSGDLNHRVIIENFNSYSQHMKSGLQNLLNNGLEAKKVIEGYNKLVNGNKSQFFWTHNGVNFDLDGLQKFGTLIGESVATPKHHLDLLQLERAVFQNSFVMQQMYGRPKEIEYTNGPNTLEEHGKTLFHNDPEYLATQGKRHTGTFDVGKHGLGGTVLGTMDVIASQIKNAEAKLTGDPFEERPSQLRYSRTPVEPGQSFFSVNGVKNYTGDYQDVQIEYVDGKPEVRSFGNMVLNAESMYTTNGIRKVVGKDKYMMELVNQDNNIFSYIVREGENAKNELSQFINQHLRLADDMTEGVQDGIAASVRRDRARRHYEGLFGLQQGTTKGFEAADRFMENVQIFNENFTGSLEDLTDADKSELTKKMKFNSLIDGKFNATEADKFWEMLPRLQSEQPIYSQFISSVKEAYPINEKAKGWEKRQTNTWRSLALNEMISDLHVQTGGELMEERGALPYESRMLHFQDRLSSRPGTINLMDANTAQGSISSYIYAENKKHEGSSAKQADIAHQRYITLVSSLQESRYMTPNQAEALLDDYHNMEGVSPSTHSQKLAAQLAYNTAIIDQVLEENKTIRSASLESNQALLQVTQDQIDQITKDGLSFASDVYGVRGKNAPVALTQEIQNMLEGLDQEHAVSKLTPNNKGALTTLLNRIMDSKFSTAPNGSPLLDAAVTVTNDNRTAFINVFSAYDYEHVVGQLHQGNVPEGVLRFEMPILGQDGTLRIGDQYVNARSSIIKQDGQFVKVTSQDKMIDMYTPKRIDDILGNYVKGETDRAQRLERSTIRSAYDTLAGVKGNIGGDNDTYVAKYGRSDVLKQGHIELPGMVHDLYDKGIIQGEDLLDEAFVGNDRSGGELKTYIERKQLNASGLSKIDVENNKVGWSSEQLGYQTYLNSVKSEQAGMTVGTVDAAAIKPMGYLTPNTRDNAVQRENAYEYDRRLQRLMRSVDDKTYLQFDTLMTTPGEIELNNRVGGNDKLSMYMKTVWMNDEQGKARLEEMKDTHYDLLQQEGIIDENGEWDHARVPTTHEQQMIINKQVAERMIMKRQKFIDIDSNLAIADDLIKEGTNEIKVGARINPGDVIAYGLDLDGNKIRGSEIRYEGEERGRIFTKDGRLGIEYNEQAHKVFVGYEKGTFAGGIHEGKVGYSAEFMEAWTQKKGIGLVLNPDVNKHKDFDSIYEGHMNQVVEAINAESDPAAKAKMIDTVNQSKLGITMGKLDNGRDYALENIKGLSGKLDQVDSNQFKTMLTDLGIDLDYKIQPVSIANVDLYSRTAGDDGGKVKYGPRELRVLQQQGMSELYRFFDDAIDEAAVESGAKLQVQGFSSAYQSLTTPVEDLGFGDEPTWNVHDFRDLPTVDNNSALYRGTILDSKTIQEANKYHTGSANLHGFVFQLPSTGIDGLQFKVEDGQTIDKVVIPYSHYMDNVRGSEFHKSQLEQVNASLFRAAQRVEEAKLIPQAGARNVAIESAFNSMQNVLSNMEQQLRGDLFESNGFATNHALKTRMPNSASGLTKIVSPVWAKEIGDEVLTISTESAKKMNVSPEFAKEMGVYGPFQATGPTAYDVMATGKDYYAPSLRNPTFHQDAIQVAKLRMSSSLPEGHQLLTSLMAHLEAADSDGDMNNVVSVDDMDAQADMKARYDRQFEERAQHIQRLDDSWERSTENAREALYGHEVHVDTPDRDLSTLGPDKNGIVHVSNPAHKGAIQEEALAKYGKQLVGMASNLNYRYTQLARSFFDESTEEGARQIAYIDSFFAGRNGLEQKIISAKHGNNGINYQPINGAEKLISNLQVGNWDEAIQMDGDYLSSEATPNGMFSDKAHMKEAISAIRVMEQNMTKEQFRDGSLRVGLSSISQKQASPVQLSQMLRGENPNASLENESYHQLLQVVGSEEQAVQTVDEAAQEVAAQAAVETQPARPAPYIPSSNSQVNPARVKESQYADRGISKLGSILDGALHSKIGIGAMVAGGIGAGALMLSNMSSSESTTPESRPHNDELIQSSHGGSNGAGMGGGSARVEQNGQGLNGMRVNVSGTAPGHISNEHIGNMANQALNSSGIQGNINVRSQDDTSSIDQQWLQQQFTQMINTGYAGG